MLIRDFFFFLKSISRELDELLGRFYLASCLVRASKSPKRSRLELVNGAPLLKGKSMKRMVIFFFFSSFLPRNIRMKYSFLLLEGGEDVMEDNNIF